MADWRIKYIDDAVSNRDAETLTRLIRDDDLAPEVRNHLANIINGWLTGQIKFPKKRPPKRGLWGERRRIALRVWETKKANKWKIESVIEQVAKEEKCSPGKVWGCWKGFDPGRYEMQREKDEYDTMMEAGHEYRAEMALESLQREFGNRADFTEEEVEAAAEELDEAWRDYDDY